MIRGRVRDNEARIHLSILGTDVWLRQFEGGKSESAVGRFDSGIANVSRRQFGFVQLLCFALAGLFLSATFVRELIRGRIPALFAALFIAIQFGWWASLLVSWRRLKAWKEDE